MESSIELCGKFLGIRFPWMLTANSSEAADNSLIFDVGISPTANLAMASDLYSLTAISTPCQWRHRALGCDPVIIRSTFAGLAVSENGFERQHFFTPAFLGPANRSYSHAHRQKVALAYYLGLAPLAISRLCDVELALVVEVIEDLECSPAELQVLACLPTEQDDIWRNLLNGQVSLETTDLAVKLLISKWQASSSDESMIGHAVIELRKYLILQGARLNTEIMQLLGLVDRSFTVRHSSVNEAQLIPGLRHPVWEGLLTGKSTLSSKNMSLNLMLARARVEWEKGGSAQERVEVVKNLRLFFAKNARVLHEELGELGHQSH